ncbi:hypothetical protein JOM56_002396 [Amanita muscaria]
MNMLKNPPFSRSASPVPVSGPLPSHMQVDFDRMSWPLSMLSLTNFRRNSPISRAQSPALANMIQDSSYLETLGLKLSEAVTRALAQPTGPVPAGELLSGKKSIPSGRGHALGALIVSELKAAQDNQPLRRAIVRLLHKPLSVLLNNLSADLSPLLASSAILASPSLTLPNPNATQIHALAIATFASELLVSFDELGNDVRLDGLKTTRDGLRSLITRVVNQLVLGLKNELIQLVESLEIPAPNLIKNLTSPKLGTMYHPSVVTLQTMAPIYARSLARYTSFADTQSILASFSITVIWKALVAFAHRPRPCQTPPPPTSAPPVSPPPSRFAIKLPPSRPPSPQPVQASTSADACAVYEVLLQFPRPSESRKDTNLAREAIEEALNGLKALVALLEAAPHEAGLDFKLEHDISGLPFLIALPVILQTWGQCGNTSIANLLGLPEEEYRKVCLGGFGRAEENGPVVAERVLDALGKEMGVNPAVLRWIENEFVL